jgi:hypothetical protein
MCATRFNAKWPYLSQFSVNLLIRIVKNSCQFDVYPDGKHSHTILIYKIINNLIIRNLKVAQPMLFKLKL